MTSFHVRASLYSVLPGGARDYLPDGEGPLPAVYAAFAVAFGLAAVAWGVGLARARSSPSAPAVGVLLLTAGKAATLGGAAACWQALRLTGVADRWLTVLDVANSAVGAPLFCALALLGAGWRGYRPLLTGRERGVLLGVVPLQARWGGWGWGWGGGGGTSLTPRL